MYRFLLTLTAQGARSAETVPAGTTLPRPLTYPEKTLMDWRRYNDQFGAGRDAAHERVMMSWDQPITGSGEGSMWPDRV
jgi:hypothetical protein